jgi:hypothetical protein
VGIIGERVREAVSARMPGEDGADVLDTIFVKRAGHARGEFSKARSFIALVRTLQAWGTPAAADVWATLVGMGIEDDLDLAEMLLENLRRSIEFAPIDVERRAYILADVMAEENRLRDWLEATRSALTATASPQDLERLGLGSESPEAQAYSTRELRRFLELAFA